MNTTLVTPSKRTTCSTISPASRLRAKPNWPVTQNTQPMAQPAWVDTQMVLRGPASISTTSICCPSRNCNSSLEVCPSAECRCLTSWLANTGSRARSPSGRSVMRRGSSWCLRCSQWKIWRPRKRGSPSSSAYASSSSGSKPSRLRCTPKLYRSGAEHSAIQTWVAPQELGPRLRLAALEHYFEEPQLAIARRHERPAVGHSDRSRAGGPVSRGRCAPLDPPLGGPRAQHFQQLAFPGGEGLRPAAVGADLVPDLLGRARPVDGGILARDLLAVRRPAVVLRLARRLLGQGLHQHARAELRQARLQGQIVIIGRDSQPLLEQDRPGVHGRDQADDAHACQRVAGQQGSLDRRCAAPARQ